VERRTYVWRLRAATRTPAGSSSYSFRSLFRDSLDRFVPAETTVLVGPVLCLSRPGSCYRWHGANESGSRDYLKVYRDYISDIVTGHENLRRVAGAEGIGGIPQAVTAAKDWAFASYRLASLKLDRPGHPLADDRVCTVAFSGVVAVMSQPYFACLRG